MRAPREMWGPPLRRDSFQTPPSISEDKMKFEIKHRWTGNIVFTAEIECDENEEYGVKLGLAIKLAVKNRARLDGASLDDASLVRARLRRAAPPPLRAARGPPAPAAPPPPPPPPGRRQPRRRQPRRRQPRRRQPRPRPPRRRPPRRRPPGPRHPRPRRDRRLPH